MKLVAKDKAEKQYYDFLPEALEIIEKPASPLGRGLIWIMSLLILIVVLWSYIGKVDTVVNARGKVIPVGNIKYVQSRESGTILSIEVVEGETVEKGQILMRLDDSFHRDEYANLEQELEVVLIEKELLVKSNNGENIDDVINLIKKENLNIDPIFIQTLKDFIVVKSSLENEGNESILLELEQANQAVTKASNELSYIRKRIKISEDELDSLKVLLDSGSISRKTYQDKENALELLNEEELIKISNVEYFKDQASIIEQKLELSSDTNNMNFYQEIIEKDKVIIKLKQDMRNIERVIDRLEIVSPVNGVVQGIGNNTVGGVVTPAQPIMSIVPKDASLVLEVQIMNRDIGFIHQGMSTEIKLDTFPFQKYGSVGGEVIQISPDAELNESLGYVYKAVVKLHQDHLNINDRKASILSGMSATCEIKLEQRRIIEFFIPAIDYLKDSIKLR